jgi:dihydrofolate reductase
MKAIAAMARNRVIGWNGQIPWHIPEDFRWFKRATLGGIVVMGRKTFESLGKPLPGRQNVVISSTREFPGVENVGSVDAFLSQNYSGNEVWVIGGSQIYAELLPHCSDLYLSLVYKEPQGDAFFPPFENTFEFVEVTESHPEFEVRHYRRT